MAGKYDSFWDAPDRFSDAAFSAVPEDKTLPSPKTAWNTPVIEFEEVKATSTEINQVGNTSRVTASWAIGRLAMTALKVASMILLVGGALFLVTQFDGGNDTATGESANPNDPLSPVAIPGTTISTIDAVLDLELTGDLVLTTPTTSSTVSERPTTTAATSPTTAAATTTTVGATTTSPPTTSPPTTTAPTTGATTTTAPTTANPYTLVEHRVVETNDDTADVTSIKVEATSTALKYTININCNGGTEQLWLYMDGPETTWPLVWQNQCQSVISHVESGLTPGTNYLADLRYGDAPDWPDRTLLFQIEAGTLS